MRAECYITVRELQARPKNKSKFDVYFVIWT